MIKGQRQKDHARSEAVSRKVIYLPIKVSEKKRCVIPSKVSMRHRKEWLQPEYFKIVSQHLKMMVRIDLRRVG